MGVTSKDDDISRDESELKNLQKVIADVETALFVSTPGTRRILENTLDGAKKRVGTLEKKIGEALKEREVEAQQQAATVAMLAQKEAALIEKEKQTYSGFLKEEFFTKKDFGKLNDFYTHSYDRLSEGGKEEMSKRIWEGIRHKQYEFADLPAEVKEREAKQAYLELRDGKSRLNSAVALPQKDRKDFITSYEAGDDAESEKVLNRRGFKDNLFVGTDNKIINSTAVTHGQDVQRATVLATTRAEQSPKPNGAAKATALPADLAASAMDFGGMRPAETSSEGAVANLPQKASTGNVRGL